MLFSSYHHNNFLLQDDVFSELIRNFATQTKKNNDRDDTYLHTRSG